MILLKFSKERATPPNIGREPPLNPVLAPQGVIGISLLLQYLIIFEISIELIGLMTISGKKLKFSV